mgnify:CR=1 FL=1
MSTSLPVCANFSTGPGMSSSPIDQTETHGPIMTKPPQY